MNDENEQYGAESFDIEKQDEVSSPQMESFDDGKDSEYMDTNIKKLKLLDLNNPDSYAGTPNPNNAQNTNQRNQFQQSMNENKAPQKPNFTGAIQQQKSVKSIMGMMNQISGTAAVESTGNAADGSTQQSFPVNIKKLKDAINALEGIEYWLPPSRGDVSKLRKIAQPVINALKAYVKNLS
jgi:hypothetical protein